MYIRECKKKTKSGKTYTNYMLVESVMTPAGPRQKSICSLGNLKPRSHEEWLKLVHHVEDALVGQIRLDGPDPEVDAIVTKVRARQHAAQEKSRQEDPPTANQTVVSVRVDEAEIQMVREAGPEHVGQTFYERLGIDQELQACGLSEQSRLLAQAMVLNRLIHPDTEHAMPDWIKRSALADLLGVQLQTVDDDQLYRNLDHLHPHRQKIEAGLAEREKRLYNLDDTIYLYDLTSTYFEGKCLRNPKAQRGYSRDHRPDCKQVVVGLVINQDGFPKAHEIFSGNRVDSTTVEEMLQALEQRVGPRPDNSKVLVVVDRGMASTHNLEEIQRHGYDYLVAAHQKERDEWLAEFETNATWREVLRENSPNNPCQKKTRMRVHQVQRGAETLVLCLSDDRVAKDRAIRESKEAQLREDVQALARRIAAGRLKQEAKLHQAIGRLRERYPRVARYYHLDYDQERQQVICEEKTELKREAEQLDGAYLLKTNRQGLEAEQIWRLYSLLTRVENAFRAIKSPLEERPIFHHLEYRVETHIFLCLLAYHLLVAIETTLRRQGVYTSWESVCQTLSTHHVATMVLPTSRGDVLHIRKGSTPEPEVCELYHQLGVPKQLMKPVKTMFLGTHR